MGNINRSDYSVEEWIDILKGSELISAKNPFQLVCTEILGMTNYCDQADTYFGFCFLETLNVILNKKYIVNDYCHIKNVEFKVLKSGCDHHNEQFLVPYLTMVNMEPLKDLLNWASSIYAVWIDSDLINEQIAKTGGYALPCDSLYKDSNQIFPVLDKVDNYLKLFKALLMFYDDELSNLDDAVYKNWITDSSLSPEDFSDYETTRKKDYSLISKGGCVTNLFKPIFNQLPYGSDEVHKESLYRYDFSKIFNWIVKKYSS